MWSYIYCNCSRYYQIALKSKDWILYTMLSNIKKYIKLHLPNKYWSILLVCQVHLPETPSEPQTYLYSIDFSIHEYTLLSHPFAHPLIFSLRLSGGKITFTCYTCFNHPLMRSSLLIWLALSSVPKTYIVNRFLSLHQCSIIQDMRPCFRCKHTTRQMLQPDTQTALTAAATIFTVIDLNVRVCREVIICVSVICVLRWDDKP